MRRTVDRGGYVFGFPPGSGVKRSKKTFVVAPVSERMARSVGVVIPAYRPDPDRLAAYARELDERLGPDAIRIELDADAPAGAGSESGADAAIPPALTAAPAAVNAVPRRRGKGAAITAGFEALGADADVLAFADADGSTPPASLASVLDPVTRGEADVAVGSRRHPNAVVTAHQTFARRYLGDAFAWAARRLLDANLYDYQCGAKAISREAWAAVRERLYESGFAWDIELVAVAAALGERIAEVPVRWEDRPGSTVSPVADSFALGRGLLAARHRAKLARESRLHALFERGRTRPPALVDRVSAGAGARAETGTGTGVADD